MCRESCMKNEMFSTHIWSSGMHEWNQLFLGDLHVYAVCVEGPGWNVREKTMWNAEWIWQRKK